MGGGSARYMYVLRGGAVALGALQWPYMGAGLLARALCLWQLLAPAGGVRRALCGLLCLHPPSLLRCAGLKGLPPAISCLTSLEDLR